MNKKRKSRKSLKKSLKYFVWHVIILRLNYFISRSKNQNSFHIFLNLNMTSSLYADSILEHIEKTIRAQVMPIFKNNKNNEMFIGLRNCDSDSFGLAQINEAKKVGVDQDKSFASSLKFV